MRGLVKTLAVALAVGMGVPAMAKTELVQKEGKWMLLKDGAPYFIKGAGGSGSKTLLAELGGNSTRTWGADDIGAELDEAQKLGLTVTVGIWMEHEGGGKNFSYSDPAQVETQLEKVRKAVTKYKDHPAVLMWAIGNEMEGKGDKAEIWKAVNAGARIAKEIDPSRPTMTVVAELGGKKVENFMALCPDVDVLGINSYGGAPSAVERYKKAGGKKPVVVTEFGVLGPWELPKNSFKASVELTSTAKTDFLKASYEKGVLGDSELCLGSYAFVWGSKREQTETWFGLLLPGGERLGMADKLAEFWGKPVKNKCPEVKAIEVLTKEEPVAGGVLKARVEIKDPEDDAVKVEWELKKEQTKFGSMGSYEPPTATYEEAVEHGEKGEVKVVLPKEAGVYRLYVYVRDGMGGAATANVPLLVK